tara:strand:+ start:47 stop:262 length:216 start_codon:yes stop_codon:yes gene_type:complete
MDDVINALLDKGASASDVSDKIKDMLFAKSAGKVDQMKNDVASSLFGDNKPESEVEPETTNEVDQEEESND